MSFSNSTLTLLVLIALGLAVLGVLFAIGNAGRRQGRAQHSPLTGDEGVGVLIGRIDRLEKAARTPKDLECPHGVQFYDVVEDGKTSPRAAWSYEAPQPKMKPVDHWIGFWEDVEIEP